MTGDVVEVWLIRTDLPGQAIADLLPLLDDRERERAEGFMLPLHRHRFIAAHGASRVIIGQHLGAPAADLRWRHGPHGKPELSGRWRAVQVSLSHSGGYAALALSARRHVGVDVQELTTGLDVARMAERFYPAAEARLVLADGSPADRLDRFTRLWARKEACVKVVGGRLMPGLRLLVAGERQPILVDPAGALPGPCLVQDVPAPDGFRAAVALAGTAPYRVDVCSWPADLTAAPGGKAAAPGGQLALP